MLSFAFVMAVLGVFVYLLFHLSFWAAFGGMYMLGMIFVVLVAGFGRQQASSALMWIESTETDRVQ